MGREGRNRDRESGDGQSDGQTEKQTGRQGQTKQ